ncbi:MAG TPA: hypothetical protein PLO63_13735 [Syntrophales bacterium]|nr:hypothetical protein [Syntrophales bacterium]
MGEDRRLAEFRWEYLKRSEKYESFCKRSSKERPTSLADLALYRNWQRFGDIYNRRFDEWWEEERQRNRKVSDLCEDLEEQYSIYAYYAVLGQETINGNVESLDDSLGAYFRNQEEDGYLYLKISLDRKPSMRSIVEIINRKIEKRTEHSLIKKKQLGNIRDEYQAYLDVYDRRKEKMKWRDIIEDIGTAADKSAEFEMTKRKYQRYHAKAIELIESAEMGIFPKRGWQI